MRARMIRERWGVIRPAGVDEPIPLTRAAVGDLFQWAKMVEAAGANGFAWVVVGERGAVAWTWAGVDIHSPRPLYDFSPDPTVASCDLLEGCACWGDGSSLAADTMFKAWSVGGESAAWVELEEWYAAHFERVPS